MSCPSDITRAPSRSFRAPSRAVNAAGPAPAITRVRSRTRTGLDARRVDRVADRAGHQRERVLHDRVRAHLLRDDREDEQCGGVAHRVGLGGLGRTGLDRMREPSALLGDRDAVEAGGHRERSGSEGVGSRPCGWSGQSRHRLPRSGPKRRSASTTRRPQNDPRPRSCPRPGWLHGGSCPSQPPGSPGSLESLGGGMGLLPGLLGGEQSEQLVRLRPVPGVPAWWWWAVVDMRRVPSGLSAPSLGMKLARLRAS